MSPLLLPASSSLFLFGGSSGHVPATAPCFIIVVLVRRQQRACPRYCSLLHPHCTCLGAAAGMSPPTAPCFIIVVLVRGQRRACPHRLLPASSSVASWGAARHVSHCPLRHRSVVVEGSRGHSPLLLSAASSLASWGQHEASRTDPCVIVVSSWGAAAGISRHCSLIGHRGRKTRSPLQLLHRGRPQTFQTQ